MPPHIRTPDELRQILVTILASATGKSELHWRAVVIVTPIAPSLSPATNWRAALSRKSAADEIRIDHAVKLLRAEHPYVHW